MPLLVEVCLVVATLAVVAIAIAALRAMVRVGQAADQFTRLAGEARQWLGQAGEFTREARDTVVAIREAIAPIRRVADRFQALGERTASLSAAVLGEVEAPIRTAVAVARGMRSFTASLLQRWSHPSTHGRPATNGGSDSD